MPLPPLHFHLSTIPGPTPSYSTSESVCCLLSFRVLHATAHSASRSPSRTRAFHCVAPGATHRSPARRSSVCGRIGTPALSSPPPAAFAAAPATPRSRSPVAPAASHCIAMHCMRSGVVDVPTHSTAIRSRARLFAKPMRCGPQSLLCRCLPLRGAAGVWP